MRFLLIMFLLIMPDLFLSSEEGSVAYSELLKRGQDLDREGKYDEAISAFRSALAQLKEDQKQERNHLLRLIAESHWLKADGSKSAMKEAIKDTQVYVDHSSSAFGNSSQQHIAALFVKADQYYDLGDVNACGNTLRTLQAFLGAHRKEASDYYLINISQIAVRRKQYDDPRNILALYLSVVNDYKKFYGEGSEELRYHLLDIARIYVLIPEEAQTGRKILETLRGHLKEAGQEKAKPAMHKVSLVMADLYLAEGDHKNAESVYLKNINNLNGSSLYNKFTHGLQPLFKFYIRIRNIASAKTTLLKMAEVVKSDTKKRNILKYRLMVSELLLQVADKDNIRLNRDVEYVADKLPVSRNVSKSEVFILFLKQVTEEAIDLMVAERALPVIDKAIQVFKQSSDQNNVRLIKLLQLRSSVLNIMNRHEEAKVIESKIKELQK